MMKDGQEMVDESVVEGVEVVKSGKSEKLEKLGKLCVSLGLQPSRMTDKMLDTIELSKDIERDQRSVIQRLSSTSPRAEEEDDQDEDDQEGDEDDQEGDGDDLEEGQSIVVEDGREKGQNSDMQLNTVGKSLKRKRIPPPLTISETNSTTASLHGSDRGSTVGENSFARSAPAHVPNFPRSSLDKRFSVMGKPKVQYLGKVPSGAPQRNSPIQSTNAYKLKTPYVSYFPRYPAPPPMPTGYPAYYPYMYPGQLPLYQSTPQQSYNPPMMPQWQPKSAVPFSTQARHYQDVGTRHKRSKKQHDHQVKKAKDKESDENLRASRSKDADNDSRDQQQGNEETQDAENNDDTESAHLAIEDNPRPFPSSEPRGPNVVGEIRISGNVFSYEFPPNRASIDKKMFMSICDKVWDESRRLVNDISP